MYRFFNCELKSVPIEVDQYVLIGTSVFLASLVFAAGAIIAKGQMRSKLGAACGAIFMIALVGYNTGRAYYYGAEDARMVYKLG